MQDGTASREEANKPGKKIQSSHGNFSGHGDAVRRFRRNPNCSEWRHDPDPLLGVHRHHSFGGKDQLIFGMKVLGDGVFVLEFVGQSGELSHRSAAATEQEGMTLFRHLLSQ